MMKPTTDILTILKDYLCSRKNNPFNQRIYIGYPKLENLTPILGITLLDWDDPSQAKSKGLGIGNIWHVSLILFLRSKDENRKETMIRYLITTLENMDRTKYVVKKQACNILEDGDVIQVTLDINITGM